MDRVYVSQPNTLSDFLKTSDKFFDYKKKWYVEGIDLEKTVEKTVPEFFGNLSTYCYPNDPRFLYENGVDFRSMYLDYEKSSRETYITETIDVYNCTLRNEEKVFQTVNEVFSVPFRFTKDKMDLGPSHWRWYNKMFRFENGTSFVDEFSTHNDILNPFYRCIIGGNFGGLINIMMNKNIPKNQIEGLGLVGLQTYLQIWKDIKQEFHKNSDTTDPSNHPDLTGYSYTPPDTYLKKDPDIIQMMPSHPLLRIKNDPVLNVYGNFTQSMRFPVEIIRHKVKKIVKKSLMELTPSMKNFGKYSNNFMDLFDFIHKQVMQSELVNDSLIHLEESAYITKFIRKFKEKSSVNEKSKYFREKMIKMRNLLGKEGAEFRYKQQYYELKYTWLLLGFQLFFTFKENLLMSHLFLYFINKTKEGDLWKQIPIKKILKKANFPVAKARFLNNIDEVLLKKSEKILQTLTPPEQFYNYAYPTMLELVLSQMIEYPEKYPERQISSPYDINDVKVFSNLREIFLDRLDPVTFGHRYYSAFFIYECERQYNIDILLHVFRPNITPLTGLFNFYMKIDKNRLSTQAIIKYYSVLLFVDSSANLVRLRNDNNLVYEAISYITRELQKRRIDIDGPDAKKNSSDKIMSEVIELYFVHAAVHICYEKFIQQSSFKTTFRGQEFQEAYFHLILNTEVNLSMDPFTMYNPHDTIYKTRLASLVLLVNPRSILAAMSQGQKQYSIYMEVIKVMHNDTVGEIANIISLFFSRASVNIEELGQFYLKKGLIEDFKIFLKMLATSTYDVSSNIIRLGHGGPGPLPKYILDALLDPRYKFTSSRSTQTGGRSINELKYKATKYKQRYLRLRSQHHYD